MTTIKTKFGDWELKRELLKCGLPHFEDIVEAAEQFGISTPITTCLGTTTKDVGYVVQVTINGEDRWGHGTGFCSISSANQPIKAAWCDAYSRAVLNVLGAKIEDTISMEVTSPADGADGDALVVETTVEPTVEPEAHEAPVPVPEAESEPAKKIILNFGKPLKIARGLGREPFTLEEGYENPEVRDWMVWAAGANLKSGISPILEEFLARKEAK